MYYLLSLFLLNNIFINGFIINTKRLNTQRLNSFDDNNELTNDEDELFSLYQPIGIRIPIYNQTNYEEFMSQFNRYDNSRHLEKTESENFNVIHNNDINFDNVGGYNNIKEEMLQCSDILLNHEKYKKYNVRTPKGLILEGPPGNGKTLLAKGFSGELNISYISVSGSQFQEKYVGVGSSRIRELFELADKNKPCIIFIDEIDAIGRKRSGDDESSSAERDSTLNELLIQLDGFKGSNGVFLICATNRIDLLDPALLRPGRLDKKIYIGNPDSITREQIIKIHLLGKPINDIINIDYLVELTNGFSGAEIENILNEALLYSLRNNRNIIEIDDLEYIMGRSIAGFQANKNIFSKDMIRRIAIHELGHGIAGFLLPNHSKLSRINLNLWSPRTPGYTIFETDEIDANIFTKEKLFSHLVVLLSGRTAEEIFYNESVTTGASKDFREAFKLAENMIINYGMGSRNIFTFSSDKYKETIDKEVTELIYQANTESKYILNESKELIEEMVEILVDKKKISRETIELKIYRKYRFLLDLL